jgi:hypothetical protein
MCCSKSATIGVGLSGPRTGTQDALTLPPNGTRWGWTVWRVFRARFILALDAKNPIFIKAFLAWRRGRVAEGGGLLNRYTV